MKSFLFVLIAILAAGTANTIKAQTSPAEPRYVLCSPHEAQILLTIVISREGVEQSHRFVHFREFQPKDRTAPNLVPYGSGSGHDGDNESYSAEMRELVGDHVVMNFWSTANSSDAISSTMLQIRVPFLENIKGIVGGVAYSATWSKIQKHAN